MKPIFPAVVGNRALCQRMACDIQTKKLSHAYILEGAKGSGKHTLALQLAAALACERQDSTSDPLPCGVCPSCHKILGKNSTDVIWINREDKATLGVEAIRDLKRDVYIPPNDGLAKIYIIEEAHLMTTQAQNALLLTLEEPPSYVLFLLLAETSATLLETVKSRAPIMRMEILPSEWIDPYLAKNSEAALLKRTNPEEYTEILSACRGSIGLALELLDPKARKPILSQRANAREFVRLCTERKNSFAVMKFLKGLGQKREEVIAQLQDVLYCVRDLLLLKQSEHPPLCFFADREEAATLAYGFTTPELLTLCDQISEAISALQMNANVRLTLTALAVGTGLL